MTIPVPTLYLAPGESRDRSGALTPTLTGDISVVDGVYGDAWLLQRKATNLLRLNPSVEDGVSGAYAGIAVSSGLTLEQDTSAATHGRASAHVTAGAGSLGKRLVWETTLLTYLTGETAAVVSVDLWGASGDVTIEASGTYVDGTTFTGTRSGYIAVPGEPARYASPVVALDPQRQINFVRLSIWLASDAADFHADAAQFETGDTATPFVIGAQIDQTIVVSNVLADLSRIGPLPESAYDPARTIHFVGDLHVGKTGSSERRAAVALDFATLDNLIAHRVYVGDLVDTGSDAGELTEAHAWIEGFTGSTHDVVFGNHDFAGDPDSGITGDTLATEWGYGARYWTKAFDDFVLIGLNCRKHGPLSPADWVYLYPEDLTFLDDTLTANAAKDCIIVFHAPLWNTVTYGSFPATDGRYAATPRTELEAILNAHANARMWVSGHTHTSTEDPRICIDLDLGDRRILCLNCSAIAYVNGGTAGVASLGPLRSPVVTIESDTIVVRWRDHTGTRWAHVGGSTSKAIPPYPVNGNIVIRYSENGTSAVAHLNGPGRFGASGVIKASGHDVTIRTTSEVTVEAVVAFDGPLTDSQKTALEALADWSSLMVSTSAVDAAFTAVGLTSARVAKLDRIGVGTIITSSPIGEGSRLTLTIGDDYNAELGNEPTWAYTGPIDLTGATVTLAILSRSVEIEIACAVQDPGEATQTITAELTSEQTATLRQSQVTRYTVSMVDGDDEATLFAGKVTVLAP